MSPQREGRPRQRPCPEGPGRPGSPTAPPSAHIAPCHQGDLNTPLGRLGLIMGARGLMRLHWIPATPSLPGAPATPATAWLPADTDHPPLARAGQWLLDYFAGRFRPPDFPLAPTGTPFQERVWRRLLASVPAGQVITYGQLAAQLGSGPRAVARAMAANPLPLVIPCHRVVAATGTGGYSGGAGVATKRWLLAHEEAAVAGERDARAC